MSPTILYRYEYMHAISTFCFFNEKEVDIYLTAFSVYKTTPKGYWIWKHGVVNIKSLYYATLFTTDRKENFRWVSSEFIKRFAYPTAKEAKVNLIKRTQKRVGYLKEELTLAEAVVRELNKERS